MEVYEYDAESKGVISSEERWRRVVKTGDSDDEGDDGGGGKEGGEDDDDEFREMVSEMERVRVWRREKGL